MSVQSLSGNSLSAIPASKHVLITQMLTQEIERGKYKVGELLPSETALARSFGVSRQTIRVALRNLRELNLITSRQGVGNMVRNSSIGSHYMFTSDSETNLFEYATRTNVKVLDLRAFDTNADLAEWIGCREGEVWWRLQTVREGVNLGERITFGQVFVPYSHGAALRAVAERLEDESAKTEDGPLFPMTLRLNMPVSDIRQTISAVLISETEARLLNVAPGSAGLLVTRHYYSRGGEVLEVARALHPANLFSYSMNISVAGGAPHAKIHAGMP